MGDCLGHTVGFVYTSSLLKTFLKPFAHFSTTDNHLLTFVKPANEFCACNGTIATKSYLVSFLAKGWDLGAMKSISSLR
jgi:hypothetical protein